MGRVSRYKKMKTCDPFNLAPGKLVDRDRAPSKEELDGQKAPRAFRQLMGYSKHVERRDVMRKAQKGSKTAGPARADARPASAGKKKQQGAKSEQSAEIAVADPDVEQRKKSTGDSFTRLPGESDKKFMERIDTEAASRLAKVQQGLRPLSDRRKKYLTNKKKRKKGGMQEPIKEFAGRDVVRFGDVVQQPPALSCKPRKAPAKEPGKGISNLQLSANSLSTTVGEDTQQAGVAQAKPKPASTTAVAGAQSIKCKKSKTLSPHERERMESARTAAIDNYRKLKKQQELERRSSS